LDRLPSQIKLAHAVRFVPFDRHQARIGLGRRSEGPVP
jgi:hypothetical protein